MKRAYWSLVVVTLVMVVLSSILEWELGIKFRSLLIYLLVFGLYWMAKDIKLYLQILAAMGLGVIFVSVSGWLGVELSHFMVMGTLFIRLLKMVIVPLVVSSIIVGVSGVGDVRSLGRLGAKTIGYYLMSSLFAIVIGLCLSNLIRPGDGVVIPGVEAINVSDLDKPASLFDLIIRMIPTNPIASFSEGDMLGMIFFSLLFGVALTRIDASIRAPLFNVINAVFTAMMSLTALIIKLAPLGVFGLIIGALSTMERSFFGAVGYYMLTIFIGLCIHFFIVLPGLYAVFTKRSPLRHFRDMANAVFTAFSTSSSSATLPVTIECVEKNAGASTKISSFVLPLGATVNMDGTALYECAGVLFIAQVMGVDLSFTQQMVVVLTALLASIGTAGIPSAGLVMIFVVLEAVNLQGPTVGLIVGTMLAVDRPLDMMRTAVNIFSDSVGTVVIAHSEGELSDASRKMQ